MSLKVSGWWLSTPGFYDDVFFDMVIVAWLNDGLIVGAHTCARIHTSYKAVANVR